MWFAKWFGGRKRADNDEPAHVVPRAVAKPRVSAPGPRREEKAGFSADRQRGFDPYNSGAFERHNAWERIGRR